MKKNSVKFTVLAIMLVLAVSLLSACDASVGDVGDLLGNIPGNSGNTGDNTGDNGDNPGDNAGETPDDNTGDNTGDNAGETPDDNTGDNGDNSGDNAGGTPGDNTEDNTGDGNGENGACEHVVGEWIIDNDSTCTLEGSKHKECTVCGAGVLTESIALKEHTLVIDEAIAATCTKMGLTDGSHCSVCNETIVEQEIIPILGHTSGEWIIDEDSTCTLWGSKHKECSVCGETVASDFIDLKEHTPVIDEAKAPTCTETGLTKGSYCSNCNVTLLEQEVIPALGHSWENDVCKNCGNEKVSEGLKYTLSSDETYYIVSGIGTCTDTDIVIPSVYNRLPVTAIASNAFKNNTTITGVVIPESVTSIGSSAFSGCTALTEIHYNATALKDLAADNKVFYNAGKEGDGITVTIGKNVTKIPVYLFYNYDSYSRKFYSPKITSVIFEEGSKCESIGSYAFYYCSTLTSVVIGNSVTSIDSFAFEGCSSLTSINIPEGVTSIGGSAFENCTALTEIYYNATALNDLSSGNGVFSNAGKEGDGITVTIGKNVTKIPVYLFRDCEGITSVIFEEGSICESIGEYEFYNCSSLTSITIPESVTSIGDWAFYGCSSLTSIIIPDSVTSIGEYAFEYCSSLTSVTIGNGVTSIGNYAFDHCTSLTEIYYNATALNDFSSNNYVFYNAGIKGVGITVTIGKNVTKIPAYLFSPYHNYYDDVSYSPIITSVIFEEGSKCESIGEDAFLGCSSLTSITIPESVTSIGDWAFYGCSSLTSVTFEDPNGWYVTEAQNAASGTNLTLTNASQNATYLNSTYYNYYWHKK